MKTIRTKTLFIFILIILQAFTFTANAQRKTLRSKSNEAFGFGENLQYKVGYKFITAGTGSFRILQKPVIINDRECYDIRFQVKSLESLNWLYKVNDNYRTVLDAGGIFPWEFEQHIREGGYKRDYKAFFDQYFNLAKVGDKQIKIPDYVHDIVSAFYYVRTLDIGKMKKDTIIKLNNFFDDTTYSLGVRIKGRETIDVDAGRFRCIVVEPIVVEGGLFKSEGSIFIWMSDDDRKIPVKVATKIPIGFVEAKLSSYSGLRGPLDAKLK